jgi:(p)ppGpp synthase/HD superfamily hydrolase
MLSRAIYIASKAHLGQRDAGGVSYILHPLRIMMRLRTDDEELQCIAVLHDAVEDNTEFCNLEFLRNEGFSERVLDALALLTHDKNVDYMDYIKAMQHNLDALRVKREDLRDNSDMTRLKGLRDKDFERINKYIRAYALISGFIERFKTSEVKDSSS